MELFNCLCHCAQYKMIYDHFCRFFCEFKYFLIDFVETMFITKTILSPTQNTKLEYDTFHNYFSIKKKLITFLSCSYQNYHHKTSGGYSDPEEHMINFSKIKMWFVEWMKKNACQIVYIIYIIYWNQSVNHFINGQKKSSIRISHSIHFDLKYFISKMSILWVTLIHKYLIKIDTNRIICSDISQFIIVWPFQSCKRCL